jgi:predicted DNA-binding protein
MNIPDNVGKDLTTFAEQNDTTVNHLLMEALVDRLEDIEDYKAISEYEQDLIDGKDEKTYSLDEVIREYGLEEEIC